MEIRWVDGFSISVRINDGKMIISANREGLMSLAAQLTELAELPEGMHIHYDDHNSLENDSSELIIEKV